uniref:RING-type domain-containing protein n=1 Tax=viral metagenome TaxID=1070528 RepID=A0A6C0DQH4_9ZZZZ
MEYVGSDNEFETGVADLEGADTGIGGNFSAANFRDGDAGSTICDRGNTINMRTAIENVFVTLGNRLSESVDEKNYTEIKRLLKLYNSNYFNSKITPFIKENIEEITLTRFNRVLKTLGSDLFNPQSIEIVRTIDVSGCPSDELLESDLKTFITRIVTEYSNVIREMTDANDALNNRILAFEAVGKNVESITSLEPNSATDEIYKGLIRYLQIFYKENELESCFKRFITAYRRFLVYKKFMGIAAASEPEHRDPLCTVCIDGPVSHVFVPCGHTFCSSCTARNLSVCFICRTQIQQRMRIYFN